MFKGSRTLNLSCALGVALAVLHVPQVYAAADMAFTAEDGLKVRLGNDAALRVGSRIHADSVSFSEDLTPLGDATDFRRARLASRLDLGDFRVRADYDVGVSRGWKNLFLEYRGLRRQRFVVGNHVAPFSMEDADGSSVMALMERSAASALNPGMLLGASYRTWGDRWSLSGGVFTNAMDDLDRRQGAGRSVIARATFAPLRGEHSVLHLGLSGERRTIDNGERVRLRARPFSRLAERRLVDTGGIDDVDSLRNVGIEFGAAHRNFRVQGEAYRASLATVTGPVDFDGQYILASMSFGARDYGYSRSRGVIRGPRANHPWGALELTARLARLNLESAPVTGGEQFERTLGVSWTYSDHLRLMLNVSDIDASPNRRGVDENVRVTAMRVQLRI